MQQNFITESYVDESKNFDGILQKIRVCYTIFHSQQLETFAQFLPFFELIVAGYGLGLVIGLFSSSVNPNIAVGPDVKQQTVREIFREMKTTSHGYGKSFAVVGALYAASECIVETVSMIVDLICLFWCFIIRLIENV